MRRVAKVSITVDAPNETAEYAQYLFDQTVDFFVAQVTKWNDENQNGVTFLLDLHL